MPEYNFELKHKAFVKHCPTCKTDYIGDRNQEKSEQIFDKHFASDRTTKDNFNSTCRECNATARVRNRTGTVVNRKEMLAHQNGLCGICQRELVLAVRAENIANVDHDEVTGKIRGILCGPCNRGIGIFKHDIKFLENAIKYLRDFR